MKFGYFSALLFCTALLLSGCGARETQETVESFAAQTGSIYKEK